METRKTTLIATVIVIALIAVGVGYAYTAYTQNGGNSTDTTYITLTQTGETGYKFANGTKVMVDTYNEESANKIYYRLTDGYTISYDNETYRVGVLGKITLHATLVGDNITNPPTKLIVNIPYSENFDANNTWQYFVTGAPNANGVINTVYATKTTAATAETYTWNALEELAITGTSGTYTDQTIYVCYGYNADKETMDFHVGDKFLPLENASVPKELSNASITFKAVSDATVTFNANNGDTPAIITEKVQMVKTGYQLPTQAPEGFNPPQGKTTFVGWNTDKTASTAISNTQTIDKDITYYAIWS